MRTLKEIDRFVEEREEKKKSAGREIQGRCSSRSKDALHTPPR
jgi:predicted transcriptional regulator